MEMISIYEFREILFGKSFGKDLVFIFMGNFNDDMIVGKNF